jgi:N-acetylglucosaminyldiphosphoundecaprenol N-acetyl-beta-D-mannosaminyltransferase
MGFIMKLEAVEECLHFVEQASPFRFCFLAVGSPQQEMLAALLRQRGIARGLALCVGASLNFLTGTERRAPLWVQKLSLEWLYRLAQNPRRLWVRYLVRGPRIFGQLRQAQVILRKPNPLPLGNSPG